MGTCQDFDCKALISLRAETGEAGWIHLLFWCEQKDTRVLTQNHTRAVSNLKKIEIEFTFFELIYTFDLAGGLYHKSYFFLKGSWHQPFFMHRIQSLSQAPTGGSEPPTPRGWRGMADEMLLALAHTGSNLGHRFLFIYFSLCETLVFFFF